MLRRYQERFCSNIWYFFHFQASLYNFEVCPLLINDNEDKRSVHTFQGCLILLNKTLEQAPCIELRKKKSPNMHI